MYYSISFIDPQGKLVSHKKNFEFNEKIPKLCLKGFAGWFYINTTECCGWINVHGYEDVDYQRKLFEWLSHNLEVRFNYRLECIEPTNFTMFSVLNQHQMIEWEPVMKKEGWVNVCEFFNPNSGNMCYQWVKTLKDKGTYA